MATILYVTVPIEFEGDPPHDFDGDVVREKFAAYRDGTVVPLLKFKAEAEQNGEVTLHWHSSTRREACYGCQELSVDGRC